MLRLKKGNEGFFMELKKRKTKTSTAVKARYNKKTYEVVRASIPKWMAEEFKQKCADAGKSQAQIIKIAIEKFISQ